MGLRRARAAAVALPLLAALACGDAGAAGGATDAGAAGEATDAVGASDSTATAEPALPTVRAGTLTVSQLVAPAPIADAPMALYLAVANAGTVGDTLLGVTAADAGAASLHETVDGGMRAVDRLAIPGGGSVRLRPGGVHVMIEDRARPFTPGDTLRATLRFARAGEMAVAAPVVAYADLERVLGVAHGDAHLRH